MSVVLRRNKGSKLSITELDNNFETLEANKTEWINDDNEIWTIRNYNSGVQLNINDEVLPWYDFTNIQGYTSSATFSNLRGGIIEYHAFISGDDKNGTIIGSITFAVDSTSIQPIHTEVLSGTSLESIELWRSDYLYANPGSLGIIDIDGYSSNVMIQWTSKLFFGPNYFSKSKPPKNQ